jgi:hypothetical protein
VFSFPFAGEAPLKCKPDMPSKGTATVTARLEVNMATRSKNITAGMPVPGISKLRRV